MMSLLIIVLVLCTLTEEKNYIINGGFEDPTVPDYGFYNSPSISGWEGSFDLHGRLLIIGSTFVTQYVDISGQFNGFIVQNMTLPKYGVYNLTFEFEPASINYEDSKAEVYWNEELVATVQSFERKVTSVSFQLYGDKGVNILKIV